MTIAYYKNKKGEEKKKKGIAASKAPVIREFSLWRHGACTDVFPAVKVDLICFYYADAFKRIRERTLFIKSQEDILTSKGEKKDMYI